MKNKNTLQPRLIAYASSILDLCESLPPGFTHGHLAKQLIRSASSAPLNYAESQASESRGDFIHKLSIVLKELRESMVCIQLMQSRASLSQYNFTSVLQENDELIAIFVASINKK
jgi:four helix bundle protein